MGFARPTANHLSLPSMPSWWLVAVVETLDSFRALLGAVCKSAAAATRRSLSEIVAECMEERAASRIAGMQAVFQKHGVLDPWSHLVQGAVRHADYTDGGVCASVEYLFATFGVQDALAILNAAGCGSRHLVSGCEGRVAPLLLALNNDKAAVAAILRTSSAGKR